jgi:chromate reductase
VAEKIVVCGIAGSLRAGSFNKMLLRAAGELAPAEMEIRPFGRMAEIPPYDADLEAKGAPEPVQALKRAVREAAAVLVCTPEYNWSVPGVLKNAIDWASRPPSETPFAGKPVALAGASPGAVGTARAQQHLRLVLASNGALVLPGPEVLVARCQEKFDASGKLADEATRRYLARLLEALAAAARRNLATGR